MTKSNLRGKSPLAFVHDTGIVITPDSRRVIIRPYIPADQTRIPRIISRVMTLDESGAEKELKKTLRYFSARHRNFEVILERQFEALRMYMPSDLLPSQTRRLLIGAYFLAEYSYESTALLFMKKLRGEKLTETEREYYSRSVKKKVIALANSDLHELAIRVIRE